MRKDRKSRNEKGRKGQGMRKERQESVQNYKREGELRQITAEKREGVAPNYSGEGYACKLSFSRFI
jgi:hypothetical protein